MIAAVCIPKHAVGAEAGKTELPADDTVHMGAASVVPSVHGANSASVHGEPHSGDDKRFQLKLDRQIAMRQQRQQFELEHEQEQCEGELWRPKLEEAARPKAGVSAFGS